MRFAESARKISFAHTNQAHIFRSDFQFSFATCLREYKLPQSNYIAFRRQFDLNQNSNTANICYCQFWHTTKCSAVVVVHMRIYACVCVFIDITIQCSMKFDYLNLLHSSIFASAFCARARPHFVATMP